MLGDFSIVPGVLSGGSGVVSVQWGNACYQVAQPMVAVLIEDYLSFSRPQFPHRAIGSKPLYPSQKAVMGPKH